MKKAAKIIFVSMLLVMALAVSIPAQAAAKKAKLLKKEKTYTVDLNGGRKENVRFSVKKLKDYNQQFRLSVDGKIVYKKKLEWGTVTDVFLADLNKKDKYKEIVVNWSGDQSDWHFFLLRYKGKKVKAFTNVTSTNGIHDGRMAFTGKKKILKGNGVFYGEVETPFSNRTFGCYYILAPAKLSDGKIKYTKAKTYRLSGVSSYVQYVFKDKYYRLAESMDLYKSASKRKVLRTCPAGTRFTPLKIKLAGKTSAYNYNLFVYVKTSDGKKGWLYFPDDNSEQYLTDLPLWG